MNCSIAASPPAATRPPRLYCHGFFDFILLDNEGNQIKQLPFGIGAFDGSEAVGIDESGTYLLNINADGNWTVRIEQ